MPATFTAQGRSVSRDLPRNSIFFLPPGHSCDLALQGHAQTLHIYLRPQLLHHRGDKPMTPMLVEADAILLHLADAIERALCERMPNSAPFVEPVAEAMAHRICIMSARAERGEVRAAGFADPELARLRQFIDAHLEDDIRVEVLARLFGLGVRSFVRSFKASTGTSPYQYVIAERIKRAKSLLAEGRTNLCDVALQCGFSHQEHLTRVFRKLTGQTPGQYRRQMTG